MTTAAAILYGAFGMVGATQVLLALVIVAATLESAFAVCIGCILFAWLQRRGVIPESFCDVCADVTSRYTNTAG